MRGLQSKIEVLEEHIKTVEVGLTEKLNTTKVGLDEKINTTNEKINSTKVGLAEKIKAAKLGAVKESTENYMKYNHSEEFMSLRKSNSPPLEKTDN